MELSAELLRDNWESLLKRHDDYFWLYATIKLGDKEFSIQQSARHYCSRQNNSYELDAESMYKPEQWNLEPHGSGLWYGWVDCKIIGEMLALYYTEVVLGE